MKNARAQVCRAAALLMQFTLLLLLFTGCAGQSVPASKPAAEPSPVPAEPSAVSAPEKEPETEVENNGGYYVRVGGRVYYRQYGPGATPKTAVSGEFTLPWNMTGCESELKALDLSTGQSETLFVESGAGPLWYADDGFYLQELVNGTYMVGWYAADGSDSKLLCRGEPLGVTENGLLAVLEYADEQAYHAIYTFYRGMSAVGTADCRDFLSLAGLTDDGLFLLETAERDDGTLHLRQITPEGKSLDLGAIPSALDASAFYDVQVDRFLATDGKVTLGVGRYAGTSHYLSEYSFVDAEPGREKSLRELDSGTTRDGVMLRLAADESGGAVIVPALPGELRIGSGEDDGTLEVWRDGSWHTMSEHLAPQISDGSGYRRLVQHMETIGGTAYVTLACAHFSPVDSLGWRDGYALLDMLYLAIDGKGRVRELAAVDCGAELYGEVWFLKDSDTLLWRQCAPEGEEYLYTYPEADHTFAIPIAEDCRREGVPSGTDGQIYARYIGTPGYYGYEIPEQPCAGRLCLTLDRDGKAVSISAKKPSTLLAIDFDVPEAQLSGAVASLPLVRRDSDEDAYWCWTKLRALEDGVRVRIERAPENDGGMTHLVLIEGAFPVGEIVYDGVINSGEFIALRASMPWHGELRVSASKDGGTASYIFGEDNYMHLETEELIHPTLLLDAAAPPSLYEYLANGMPRSLCGTWLFDSPLTGKTAAVLHFTEEDGMVISTEDAYWQLGTSFHWLYAGDWGAPDLVSLQPENEDVQAALGFDWGGDYLMEFYRTDGEELLHLTQTNNGDGSLDKLLPDAADEWIFGFTLRRSGGVGDIGAYRRNVEFYATAARYDAENGVVWLREVEQVDSYPGGGAVRCAIPDAPCLPYRIASAEAAALLASCHSPEYPMRVCRVVTDGDGTVTQLQFPED